MYVNWYLRYLLFILELIKMYEKEVCDCLLKSNRRKSLKVFGFSLLVFGTLFYTPINRFPSLNAEDSQMQNHMHFLGEVNQANKRIMTSTEQPSTEEPSTEQPSTPGPPHDSTGPRSPDSAPQNNGNGSQQPYEPTSSGYSQNSNGLEVLNHGQLNGNLLLPSYNNNHSSIIGQASQNNNDTSAKWDFENNTYFNPLSSDRYYQNLDRNMLALMTGEIGALPDNQKTAEKMNTSHRNDDKVREINQNGENLEANHNGNEHDRTRDGLNFLKYIGIALASVILIAGFSYIIWKRIKNGN